MGPWSEGEGRKRQLPLSESRGGCGGVQVGGFFAGEWDSI